VLISFEVQAVLSGFDWVNAATAFCQESWCNLQFGYHCKWLSLQTLNSCFANMYLKNSQILKMSHSAK